MRDTVYLAYRFWVGDAYKEMSPTYIVQSDNWEIEKYLPRDGRIIDRLRTAVSLYNAG